MPLDSPSTDFAISSNLRVRIAESRRTKSRTTETTDLCIPSSPSASSTSGGAGVTPEATNGTSEFSIVDFFRQYNDIVPGAKEPAEDRTQCPPHHTNSLVPENAARNAPGGNTDVERPRSTARGSLDLDDFLFSL